MQSITKVSSALLLAGVLALSAAPALAQEVLFKTVVFSGYCHMQFPAIQEDTLTWPHPVLKSADSGDIIDFYGPCNHNPTGKDEAAAQLLDMRNYDSDGE